MVRLSETTHDKLIHFLEKLKMKLSEYQERFDKLDTLRVDEKLRPEKLNNDEVLGYYGSFRQISVD